MPRLATRAPCRCRAAKKSRSFAHANRQFYALVNKCPHKQGPLSQGIVHGNVVTCPLHNWRISLKTGEALGDDKGCVPTIPLKVDAGRILIWPREAVASRGPGGVSPDPHHLRLLRGRLRHRGDANRCADGHDHRAMPGTPPISARLCSKGTHLGETVGLEGRLLHPMIGDGPRWLGQSAEAVADGKMQLHRRARTGQRRLLCLGQLLTEDYYVANKLMKGFIGSANIDTNSRLCMASAVAAHNRAFGEDIVPCYL
jgi:nitrite reductase/ring-hydroxylating ferredoxin subunit